jgi:hypothetical protein
MSGGKPLLPLLGTRNRPQPPYDSTDNHPQGSVRDVFLAFSPKRTPTAHKKEESEGE